MHLAHMWLLRNPVAIIISQYKESNSATLRRLRRQERENRSTIRVTGETCFCGTCKKWDTKIFLDVTKKHILSGSIIHTNLWQGYNGIVKTLDLQHCAMNHSVDFKNPQTNAHTNAIEGPWNGFKIQIPSRFRMKKDMNEWL
uniref:DDE_Tnp_IS1595 domain-containing protein n=1 Tax=Strongyloides papillosus TaxID=174720 RepID=A0A0N5BNY8_STREA